MAHIYAIAGMAKVNYSATVYDYGVDGHFNEVVIDGNKRIPSGFALDYQAKASVDWTDDGGDIVYDLDARAYNNIVGRSPAATSMILILLCLPSNEEQWHETCATSTTIRHCCYWYVASGDLTENVTAKRIRIPKSNILTPEVLKGLLDLERIRRQDQWK